MHVVCIFINMEYLSQFDLFRIGGIDIADHSTVFVTQDELDANTANDRILDKRDQWSTWFRATVVNDEDLRYRIALNMPSGSFDRRCSKTCISTVPGIFK